LPSKIIAGDWKKNTVRGRAFWTKTAIKGWTTGLFFVELNYSLNKTEEGGDIEVREGKILFCAKKGKGDGDEVRKEQPSKKGGN